MEFRADRHTCGRQLTEALYNAEQSDPDYVAIHFECLGCKAEDDFWRTKRDAWKQLHEQGIHPERWTLPVVMTRAEAVAHRQAALARARHKRG